MRKKLLKTALMLLLAAGMLLSLVCCSKSKTGNADHTPSVTDHLTAAPILSPDPLAGNTPVLTEEPAPASTEASDRQETEACSWDAKEYKSIKGEYAAMIEDYLSSGEIDDALLSSLPSANPACWFDNPGRFEGGSIGAFSSYLQLSNEEDAMDHYLCVDCVSELPLETYKEAIEKIIEYRKQYWGMDSIRTQFETENFGSSPMQGYCGEDWFILPDWEVCMNRQVITIWRTDDGENYYEFGAKNGERGELTDAVILSDKVGYLCLTGWDFEEGRGFRVFATDDGGESWKALELEVPQEYSGYGCSFAYAPVFKGERGALAVCLYYDDYRRETLLFETSDGGSTWRFISRDAE